MLINHENKNHFDYQRKNQNQIINPKNSNLQWFEALRNNIKKQWNDINNSTKYHIVTFSLISFINVSMQM